MVIFTAKWCMYYKFSIQKCNCDLVCKWCNLLTSIVSLTDTFFFNWSSCADFVFKWILLQCSLSVTKWIHLNWGDDGLITLFTKIWRLLHPVIITHSLVREKFFSSMNINYLFTRAHTWKNACTIGYHVLSVIWTAYDHVQGGIFVLEPQPWESYEKNRKVSEV